MIEGIKLIALLFHLTGGIFMAFGLLQIGIMLHLYWIKKPKKSFLHIYPWSYFIFCAMAFLFFAFIFMLAVIMGLQPAHYLPAFIGVTVLVLSSIGALVMVRNLDKELRGGEKK